MSAVPGPRTFGIWLLDEPYRIGDVTISRVSEDHRQLVEHGEMWVPRSFTASFDRLGLSLLELDIALIDGRFRCVELRMRRRGTDEYVAASDLRQVAIARLVSEAVRLVCYFRDELVDEESVEFAREVFMRVADLEKDPVDIDSIRVGDFFRYPALAPLLDGEPDVFRSYSDIVGQLAQQAEHSQRRPGITTDEAVAAVYTAAYRRGDQVIEQVAEAFSWQFQTAKNRILAARAAGLLPPTTQGRRRA